MSFGDLLRNVDNTVHVADALDRLVDEFGDDPWEEEEIRKLKLAINEVYELLEHLSIRVREEADAYGQAEDCIDVLAGLVCRAARGEQLGREDVARALAGTPYHADVFGG
jgi:hypothetical protein